MLNSQCEALHKMWNVPKPDRILLEVRCNPVPILNANEFLLAVLQIMQLGLIPLAKVLQLPELWRRYSPACLPALAWVLSHDQMRFFPRDATWLHRLAVLPGGFLRD